MIYSVLRYLLDKLDVPAVSNSRLRSLVREQLYQDSLRTIHEVLCDLNIDSKAYEFDRSKFHLVECPVIAHLREHAGVFVVVVSFQNGKVEYFDPVSNKTKQEVSDVFFEKWTGVALVPDANDRSGDSDYLKRISAEKQKKIITLAVILGMCISIIFLFAQTIHSHPQYLIDWTFVFLVKILALPVVFQIVVIEFRESNTLINKVCRTSDCGKVVHSKASKLFSWLTMGDIGMMYFAFGALTLIIAPFTNHIASIVYLLFFLNLFTLPYTLFSIYYQRFVLKAWCPFCLAVMSFLWIEFFLGFIISWTKGFHISPFLFLLSCFSAVAVSIGWFVTKRKLQAVVNTENLQKYVNMLKKDADLFKAFLTIGDAIPEFTSASEIVLGNENAKNVFIAIINPFCHSCSVLFNSIRNFLSIHPNKVKVIIRLKTGIRDEDWDNKIIEYVLGFYLEDMQEKALSILEEWYGMENKDIEKWKKECGIKHFVVSDDVIQLRKEYQRWFLSVDLHATPLMVLDNKVVPKYYTFNDICYFLKRI